MSRAVSPSVDRLYGLVRVARCWNVSRATVYRHREAPAGAKRRPGPVGPCDDATLLQHIKQAIAESRFTGEGYRTARLVLERSAESDGNVYFLVDPAAKALEDKQPLAATGRGYGLPASAAHPG